MTPPHAERDVLIATLVARLEGYERTVAALVRRVTDLEAVREHSSARAQLDPAPAPVVRAVRFVDVADRLYGAFRETFPRGLTRGGVASAVRHGEEARRDGRRPTHLLGNLRPIKGGVRSDDVETLVAHLIRERERAAERVNAVRAHANARKREQGSVSDLASAHSNRRMPS